MDKERGGYASLARLIVTSWPNTVRVLVLTTVAVALVVVGLLILDVDLVVGPVRLTRSASSGGGAA